MKIQQLIDEQMKEFDKSIFHGPDFLNNFARKLIEALGEEIIPQKFFNPLDMEGIDSWNACADSARLKLKEIISSFK